ncbi:hypothetical protein [Cellulosimicrobium cellulans]|uniref:hypothetical protein n=1 Tax=Cellulosimicrobium cellulans TaxID=1710 RepID=UPI0002E5E2F2|nr:hypothetical protein [Cellulosimicrobium cellulans]
MTTTDITTAPAPTWSIDLIGRPAIRDGERTTITAVRGEHIYTADTPGVARAANELVALPVLGEHVRTAGGTTGYWIGTLDDEPVPACVLRTVILCDNRIQTFDLNVAYLDARTVVDGRASEGERAAMGALLTTHLAHLATIREHRQWIDTLTADAHEHADDQQWCEQFDDFMDEHGLARRARDYELRVQVTATVYLSRNAVSLDAAIDALDGDTLLAALAADDLAWDAEED